jgi:hypothetical protein
MDANQTGVSTAMPDRRKVLKEMYLALISIH